MGDFNYHDFLVLALFSGSICMVVTHSIRRWVVTERVKGDWDLTTNEGRSIYARLAFFHFHKTEMLIL